MIRLRLFALGMVVALAACGPARPTTPNSTPPVGDETPTPRLASPTPPVPSPTAPATTPPGHSPTPPPGDGEVAFVADQAIWILTLATAEVSRLTEGAPSRDPAWSPDGQRLAYTTGSENSEIFTIRPGGSAPAQITNSPHRESFPDFSPDGDLYFLRHRIDGEHPTIEIVRHGGDGVESVVHTEPGGLCGPTGLDVGEGERFLLALDCGRGSVVLAGDLESGRTEDLAERYLEGSAGCAYAARWARDHPWLATLTSVDCAPEENSRLTLIDLAGSPPAVTGLFSGARIGILDWAPGDQALLFDVARPDGESAGLWLLDLDSREPPRQIRPEGSSPAWRPVTPRP